MKVPVVRESNRASSRACGGDMVAEDNLIDR